MIRAFLLLLLTSLTPTCLSQTLSEIRFQWAATWPQLEIPYLRLDYQAFLNANLQSESLKEQEAFFSTIQQALKSIDTNNLSATDRLDFEIMSHETRLNRRRLTLIAETTSSFKGGGLYDETNGKAWYTYLVKHWTSTGLTPEDISTYGWKEVKRIQTAMKQLEARYTMNPTYTEDPQVVEVAFKAYETFLVSRMWEIMPPLPTPSLEVRRGTNQNLSQVPGYYGSDVLSYNLFDTPFDLSQIDWLYLHEGVPGHHFQLNSERQADIPEYRTGLSYSGFREGWAAYVEELAQERGWYIGPEQRYSQMEWDLIRSIRLVLDVGLNYEGWSDEKALDLWRTVIPQADHIGNREIARMRRWPAQVLTYKIGAKAILETRDEVVTKGSPQALQDFHTKLLSKGSIPVSLLSRLFETSEP